MFKLVVKLSVLTLFLMGMSLFVSGGKASAATCNWAPGSNWGINTGAQDHGFASVTVHAQDGSNGNPINTFYQLSSKLPPGNYSTPAGVDPDARIFSYPIGTGRDSQHWFRTGENLHGGPSTYSCDGWDQLGPGTPSEQGNQWVLDCAETDLSTGQEKSTHFWISSIPHPGGQDGHWSAQVSVDGGPSRTVSNNLDTDPMSFANDFEVTNGVNARVDLVWHPQPQRQQDRGICNFLDVYNEGTYTNAGGDHPTRAHVEVSGVTGVSVNGSGSDWSQHGIDGYAPDANGSYSQLDKIWRYTAEQVTINITVTKQSYFGQGSNAGWHTIGGGWSQSRNCISTQCSITSVVDYNNRPNGVIAANDQVTVNGYITNTSPSDGPNLNWPYLSGTGGNSNGAGVLGPGGGSGYVSLDLTAPNSAQNWTLSYSVAGVPATASCSITVPVYESFTLEPHANLTYNTAENPGNIGYSTYIQNNSSQAISAPTTSSFKFTPYSGGAGCPSVGPVNSNGPYNPGGPDYTINPATCAPSSVDAGDQYCSEIDLTGYNQGWVGPGGSLVGVSLNGSATDKKCFTVTNEPYFKVYGGGVSAGGDFSTNGDGKCTGGGLLAGYNDNADSVKRGAGSQLSALALIKITGFASAQASAPTSAPPGTALTFANTLPGDITSDKESPSLGGNFDPGGSHCLPDVTANSGTITKAGPYAQPGISGISDDESVFVNGDVRITGNITYSNSWSISNVPSFVLHATGNIYIDPGVTQLDGLYISNKKIYTCGNGTGYAPMSASDMFNGCNNQLTVNGSLVATQINFMRSFGSLRDEQSSPFSCSHGGITSSPRKTCAAEVIEFSPELFLSTPAIQLPSNGAVQYDAITSLPPVL